MILILDYLIDANCYYYLCICYGSGVFEKKNQDQIAYQAIIISIDHLSLFVPLLVFNKHKKSTCKFCAVYFGKKYHRSYFIYFIYFTLALISRN